MVRAVIQGPRTADLTRSLGVSFWPLWYLVVGAGGQDRQWRVGGSGRGSYLPTHPLDHKMSPDRPPVEYAPPSKQLLGNC